MLTEINEKIKFLIIDCFSQENEINFKKKIEGRERKNI